MTEYDLGKVVGEDGAKGDKGDTGNGISSIRKTGTSGKVDTYTITYTDGTTSTFTVTNGSDASVTIDSALSSSSTNPVQNKIIKSALDNKADSSDVPTKTSDLTNDSGFITSSSVPSASSTTPSADTTTGSVGTGVTWARSNHTHPKSSLYAEATHTHSEYINPTIADNLTTNDATQVLSAKQGKVLNDLIGDAITYINGTGGS